MPTTPIIQSIGSTSGADVPGRGRNNLVNGETVALSDTEPLNVGASYLWVFEDTPIGSTAGIINATTSTPSFVVDVASGSYKIRCTVDGVSFSVEVLAVPLPVTGGRIPAFKEELEYDEGGNTKGWHYSMSLWMRDVDTAFGVTGTLDQAYDFGSAGGGRSITADVGAVTITNPTANAQNVLELTTTALGTGAALSIVNAGDGPDILWGTNKLVGGSLYLAEKAAAAADTAALGQVWVKNDAPNTLWFTDDTGVDHQLGVGVGDVVGPASSTDNAIARFDGVTGKLLQDTAAATVSDAGVITAAGLTMGGIATSDILISSDGASTSDSALVTAGYVDAHAGGGGVTTLSVADIDDPSTELNAIAGSAKGDLRLCYQTVAGRDQWTLYAWDDADSVGEKVPLRVDGSSGMWAAVAGRYQNAMKMADDGGDGATATLAAYGFASDSEGFGGLRRHFSNGDILLVAPTGDNLNLGAGNVYSFTCTSGHVAGGLRPGTEGAPYWFLSSDTDTGIFRPGANRYAVSTGGTKAGEWDASQNYIASANINPDTDSANDLGSTSRYWSSTYSNNYFLTEKAAAVANVATKGEVWVKNDAPNTLWFTDDTGVDHQLGVGGSHPDPHLLSDGVVGAPTYSFSGTPTAGMYLEGTNSVGFAAGGTLQLSVSTLRTHVRLAGTEAFPSLVVGADNNWGFWKSGSTALVLSTGGVEAVRWDASQNQVNAGSISLLEKAAAAADTAAYGQIWVKNDAPNTLWFTDDTGFDAKLALANKSQAFTGAQYTDVTTLTDAATIAIDASANNAFKVTITAARVLGNPTNAVEGMAWTVRVTQDGTGSRALTFGANYTAPVAIDTSGDAANSERLLTCVALSATKIVVLDSLGAAV